MPNSKGRLTSVGSSVSTTNYTAYDVSGQITGSNQVTDNVTYAMSYGYDRAGNLTAQTYPSGRVVTTAYDNAGRMRELAGQKAGEGAKTYASSVSYTAHGAVGAMRLGNNLWEHTAFNSRYQPTEIGLGSSSVDSSKLRLGYDYGTIDNIGSIKGQTISAPGVSLVQGYIYDTLNRLETAQETSGAGVAWRQKFAYDRFGNRNYVTGETQMPAGMDVVNASFVHPNDVVNNRYAANQGYGYDTAGNLTAMPGSGTYAYDAENRQTNYNNAATYHYDGNAKRVKKVAGSVTTVFVYDAGGLLVAEYANDTPQSGGTSYFTDDHLGSNRVQTDANGNIKARHDYLPFGEELCSGTGGRTAEYKCAGDPVRQKFTGKERDAETGLDYFLARYYSGKQGRFTSPDEFTGGPDEFYDFGDTAANNPTFYADLDDPQSLNKFTYCLNNPLLYVDPDGHNPKKILKTLYKAYQKGSVTAAFADDVQDVKTVFSANASVGERALAAVSVVSEYASPVSVRDAKAGIGAAKSAFRYAEGTIGALRNSKNKAGDAHHVIQNKAVEKLPGYNTREAPGIELPGRSKGTPHEKANRVQDQRGGGTYAAERRIGYKALRRAGVSKTQSRGAIKRADDYFIGKLKVKPQTRTEIPKRRR